METDEHGYFRFIAVPGGEPYFVFAVPPGQTAAMRNFDYFGVAAVGRRYGATRFCIRIASRGRSFVASPRRQVFSS